MFSGVPPPLFCHFQALHPGDTSSRPAPLPTAAHTVQSRPQKGAPPAVARLPPSISAVVTVLPVGLLLVAAAAAWYAFRMSSRAMPVRATPSMALLATTGRREADQRWPLWWQCPVPATATRPTVRTELVEGQVYGFDQLQGTLKVCAVLECGTASSLTCPVFRWFEAVASFLLAFVGPL